MPKSCDKFYINLDIPINIYQRKMLKTIFTFFKLKIIPMKTYMAVYNFE